MAREGRYLMAGVVAVLVVAIPFATIGAQIALIIVRRSKAPSRKLVTFLGFLDKWTMIDVFALATLIVVVKIGAVADVSPRLGLGCLAAGIFLSMSTSWLMKG